MSNSTTVSSRANESQAGKVAAALITCPAIAAFFVALRIYTRVFLTRKHFLEDYCIAATMIFSIGLSICVGITVLNGLGRHIETVTREEFILQFKVSVGGIQFYIYTHLFLKLSIMLQYIRISIMPFEKRLCYMIVAFLISQSLCMSIMQLCLCKPFQALWDNTVPGATCLPRTPVYFAQLGFNIAMDFLILVCPVFILRHLNLPWQQRVAISIVLSFGGMACIVSVLRLLTVYQSTQSTDSTWDKVPSAFYGIIEPNLGIICACLVTLRPLFHRYFSSTIHWIDPRASSTQTQAAPIPEMPRPRVHFPSPDQSFGSMKIA